MRSIDGEEEVPCRSVTGSNRTRCLTRSAAGTTLARPSLIQGENMGEIYYGTMDGQPAKFVYHPDRQQTFIFWGGLEKPDGFGHNHASIVHSEAGDGFKVGPDSFHFLRQSGRIVVNHSYDPKNEQKRRQKVGDDIIGIFGTALRKAIDFNLRNLRGG